LADAADHAGQQGVGEHLALLGDEPPAHADLAILAVDRALNLDFQRCTVSAHTRQTLGTQVGPLGTDVAIAGGHHEALPVFGSEAVGQEGVV
jgi:hypothetical protein